MGSLSQDLTGIARQGFDWWTGELASLVPKGFRDSMQPERPEIVVELRDGRLSLVRDPSQPASGQPASGQSASGPFVDELLTEQALLDRLASRHRPGSPPAAVQLRLPHSACLVRRIEVPDKAQADAARILELDLERSTPLDAAEIYTAHYRDAMRSANGTTGYVQLIIKKSTIDRAVARLEAAGLPVHGIDCWSEAGGHALPVNFLHGTGRRDASGTKAVQRLGPILAALAAALIASSVWISISRHQTALTEIESQTVEARARVTKIETGRDLSDSTAKEAAEVIRLKANRPAVVHILDELTRLLPDTASLMEFSVDGGDVNISGFSKNASELVPLLERSQMFADANLSAPITFDDARTKERFSYRLHLRTAPRARVPEPASDGEPVVPDEGAVPGEAAP